MLREKLLLGLAQQYINSLQGLKPCLQQGEPSDTAVLKFSFPL